MDFAGGRYRGSGAMTMIRTAMTVAAGTALIVGIAMALLPSHASAQSAQPFPYGRELRLDVDPMRGSKKVPVFDIGTDGTAEIELWCNLVKARLVVAANTITIITSTATSRQCGPELLRADNDLLTALTEATQWRMDDTGLVLAGGRTLRFVVQTN